MTKKNIFNLLFSGCIIFTTACSDKILDIKDEVNLDIQNYFNKPEQIVEAANATYAAFYFNRQMNLEWPEIFDNLANEVTPLAPIASAWPDKVALNRYQHNNTTSSLEGYWRMLYRMILRANLTIDKGNSVLANYPSNARLKQAIGEAHFLRGWAYMQLAFQWGRVPIRISFNQSNQEHLRRSDNVEQVWAVSESDFKNAQHMLPPIWDNNNLGRATSGAATAFLGKLYLYTKKYTQAETELMKIYGAYTLLSDSAWLQNFDELNENNSESIFEIQFSFTLGDERWWMYTEGGTEGNSAPATSTWHTKSYSWVQSGWKNYSIPDARVRDFVYSDLNGNSYTDPRAALTFYGNSQIGDTIYCESCPRGSKKYDFKANGYRFKKHLPHEYSPIVAQESGINLRLMRYADVILMIAECKIQNDEPLLSLNYINEVRKRIGAYEYKGNYTKLQAFELLKRERQLEFMFEQSRFNDLKRWGLLEETLNSEIISGKIEKKHYLFPIPKNELDTNLKFGEIQDNWN